MNGKLISLLALSLVVLGGWFYSRRSPQQNALLTRELATLGLAEHLSRNFPGQRALVVSNPFTQRKGLAKEVYTYEQAGIRGLQKGFAGKVTVEAVAFPELKSEAQKDPRSVFIDPATTTPLSYLVAEGAFDALSKQHPNCDLIVSLVGLPVDLSLVEIWQKNGAPKFALLLPDLRVLGDAAAVMAAVKSGKLAAFVLNKPSAPPEQTAHGKDRAQEFNRRFILVTPQNIEQVAQDYPQLF